MLSKSLLFRETKEVVFAQPGFIGHLTKRP